MHPGCALVAGRQSFLAPKPAGIFWWSSSFDSLQHNTKRIAGQHAMWLRMVAIRSVVQCVDHGFGAKNRHRSLTTLDTGACVWRQKHTRRNTCTPNNLNCTRLQDKHISSVKCVAMYSQHEYLYPFKRAHTLRCAHGKLLAPKTRCLRVLRNDNVIHRRRGTECHAFGVRVSFWRQNFRSCGSKSSRTVQKCSKPAHTLLSTLL